MAGISFESKEQHDEYIDGLNKLDSSKKKVLIAYEKTLNVSQAVIIAGIHRATWYYYRSTDWIFDLSVKIMDEYEGDLVDSKIREMITGIKRKRRDANGNIMYDSENRALTTDEYEHLPNTTLLIFLAKTKHKNRGYIETPEPQQTFQPPVFIDWREGIDDKALPPPMT